MKLTIHRRRCGRRLWCLAAAALLLGGCVWPMDPVPTWDLEFEGRVVHAATGAPVERALVQLWLQHPQDPDAAAGPPFLEGQTNASGEFRFEQRERSRVPPAFAIIRVTPPAERGLTAQTVGGMIQEAFHVIRRSGRRVLHTTEISLAPAP